MIRRLTGAVVAALLAMPVLAEAQTSPRHPDFTGTWRVASIEMPLPPAGDDRDFGGGRTGAGGRGFGGRRGRANAGGDPGADAGGAAQRLEEGQTVRIRQTDDRLIVTEEAPDGPVMSSYALDGRETSNNAGNATTKSKSKWEGVAIVTDSTRTTEIGRTKFQMKSREVRSLSADARTMTVRSELDTPRGKQTMTVTYSKVDD